MADGQQSNQVDLEALKARQRVAWSSGNYAIVGTTLQSELAVSGGERPR